MRRSATRRAAEYFLVATALSVATAAITWPHARHFTTSVVNHFDPQFSMWRLGWFAHAVSSGEHLPDANIFFPEPGTLLLSDAVLLQAAVAAPALWSGVPLPVVYNSLLLLGIVSSGVALYHLATLLGVGRAPAFLGGAVFALAPYRLEHLMHLELQWIAPGVLVLASLDRLLQDPGPKPALALGLFAAAQFLACVYYAVFLVPLVLILAILAAPRLPRLRRTVAFGAMAAAIAGAATLPVAALYLRQSERVGQRSTEQLASYSATPENYLAAPRENLLYGGTADWLGSGERRLFPGAVALVLGCVGLWSRRRRAAVASAVVVVVATILSFGMHAAPYRLLHEWWPVLHGLRAPARYAVFVLAGVALLAALGIEHVFVTTDASRRRRRTALALALLVLGLEYCSPQTDLWTAVGTPPVYAFLARLPDGIVLELPLPAKNGLDLDADYMYWSTRHWRKLINGYSGYYPPSYRATRERLASFPDESSMALLRERNVRYVLLHTVYMRPRDAARLRERLQADRRFWSLGTFRDWAGPTDLFEIPSNRAELGAGTTASVQRACDRSASSSGVARGAHQR